MSEEVKVSKLPPCDICTANGDPVPTRAAYDGKTTMGPWANMCTIHFQQLGTGLGTGKGQRLVER